MNTTSPSLDISIVTFDTPVAVLQRCLDSVFESCEQAAKVHGCLLTSVTIVNNGTRKLSSSFGKLETEGSNVASAASASKTAEAGSSPGNLNEQQVSIRVLEGQGNVGYGKAHNLAIHDCKADYTLILNPDVYLEPDAISEGLKIMTRQADTVAISPACQATDGTSQLLCKNYPRVLQLMLRGFAPQFIQWRFRRYLAAYTVQPAAAQESLVSIISGCFMLCRTEALKAVNGFDERYFLYFEDFDLSLRLHAQGNLRFVPAVRIVHEGGFASRKGPRHIAYFARSAFQFFNSHGWRLV